ERAANAAIGIAGAVLRLAGTVRSPETRLKEVNPNCLGRPETLMLIRKGRPPILATSNKSQLGDSEHPISTPARKRVEGTHCMDDRAWCYAFGIRATGEWRRSMPDLATSIARLTRVFCVGLLLSSACLGAEVAVLGRVLDPQGRSVPGANVKLQ